GALLGRVITNWWAWNPAGGPSRRVYAGWWCSEMIRVGPRTVMVGSRILIMPPRIAMVDQPAGRILPGCVLPVTRSKKTPGGHTKQHQNTLRRPHPPGTVIPNTPDRHLNAARKTNKNHQTTNSEHT